MSRRPTAGARIDAAIIVGGILLIAAGYVLRALFLTPDPTLTSLEPTRIAVNRNVELMLTGDRLRPDLKARIELGRRDWPRPLSWEVDLVFSNGRTLFVPMVVESSQRAIVHVRPLPAGTYDFALYEESREVARIRQALRIGTGVYVP